MSNVSSFSAENLARLEPLDLGRRDVSEVKVKVTTTDDAGKQHSFTIKGKGYDSVNAFSSAVMNKIAEKNSASPLREVKIQSFEISLQEKASLKIQNVGKKFAGGCRAAFGALGASFSRVAGKAEKIIFSKPSIKSVAGTVAKLKEGGAIGTNIPVSLYTKASSPHALNVSKSNPDVKDAIGSQGLIVSADGKMAASHESYGDASDKTDKAGRNLDRVYAGVDGTIVIGDGSGPGASSFLTANAIVEYAVSQMNEDKALFGSEKSEADCKKSACEMLKKAISIEDNPLIKFGTQEEKGELKTGGTTAIFLKAQVESENVVFRGAGVGDCIAFVLSDEKGCEELYSHGDLSKIKDVTDPGGQLQSPEMENQGNDGSFIVDRKPVDADKAVKGIYKECPKGSVAVSASDGLADNLNLEDKEAVILFLAKSPAFDAIPGEMPPNQYDPKQSLPKLVKQDDGSLKYEETAESRLPGKPNSAQLQRLFSESKQDAALPSSEVIATRLSNYVAWISTGLKESEEVVNDKGPLSIISDLVGNNFDFAEIEGYAKEKGQGIKDMLDLSSLLQKLSNDDRTVDPAKIAQLKNIKVLVDTIKNRREPESAVLKCLTETVGVSLDQLNSSAAQHALFCANFSVRSKAQGLQGKYDDVSIVVSSAAEVKT